jgi:beta-N-acetylhexosaminidase
MTTGTATTTPSAAPSTSVDAEGVDRIVAGMSLRAKVRQLIVVQFTGTVPPLALLGRLRPGGVIYFGDNLVDAAQVRLMSDRIQRTSRRAGVAALIMTDQEGGTVTRLPGPVSSLPGGIEFHGNADWARRVARRTGAAMRRMGLNVDLAPVADVDTVGDAGVIGPRSFGSRPGVVSRLVGAQICGYHRSGVGATVKHFPGHGSTRVDSHDSLPTLHLTKRRWRQVHLPPFQEGIRDGVDLVMAGHLAYPALDGSGTPASLSRPMVTGWIRHRLGYHGVVITDALDMGALSAYGSSGEIAVRAVQAGVDLLLMPVDPVAAVRAILDAVHDGRLSEARIDGSVHRILALKARLGLLGQPSSLGGC